jgi:hypothetical protein
MVKVYSVPKEVGEKPSKVIYVTQGHKVYQKAIDTWIEKIVEFAKTYGSGDMRGEIVKFPVGDGCARYVVYSISKRSVELIHLPVYDSSQLEYIHRLTADDIRETIRQSKLLKPMKLKYY